MIFGHEEINSHNWRRTINAPLNQADHDQFQAQLDKLVGVEADGTKRLKLIWMPSFERWDAYRARWIPFRCVRVETEITPAQGNVVAKVKHDFIGIPRYAIVGLVPEASRPAASVRLLDGFDKDGHAFAADRTEHEYSMVLGIWEHDPRLLPGSNANVCCAAWSSEHRKKCWGKYRAPDQLDIDFLSEQMAMFAPMFESKPHERGTDKDRWRMAQMLTEVQRQKQIKEDEEDSYIIKTDLLSTFTNKVYSLPNLN